MCKWAVRQWNTHFIGRSAGVFLCLTAKCVQSSQPQLRVKSLLNSTLLAAQGDLLVLFLMRIAPQSFCLQTSGIEKQRMWELWILRKLTIFLFHWFRNHVWTTCLLELCYGNISPVYGIELGSWWQRLLVIYRQGSLAAWTQDPLIGLTQIFVYRSWWKIPKCLLVML